MPQIYTCSSGVDLQPLKAKLCVTLCLGRAAPARMDIYESRVIEENRVVMIGLRSVIWDDHRLPYECEWTLEEMLRVDVAQLSLAFVWRLS